MPKAGNRTIRARENSLADGDAAPHPGDVTPLLGDERFTLTHPFYSPRSLCSSIQKSTRSRTAYLRGLRNSR